MREEEERCGEGRTGKSEGRVHGGRIGGMNWAEAVPKHVEVDVWQLKTGPMLSANEAKTHRCPAAASGAVTLPEQPAGGVPPTGMMWTTGAAENVVPKLMSVPSNAPGAAATLRIM